MQTPIPHRCVKRPEDVPRNVFCTHYESCLDYTIEMNWQGFSCEACNGYELETALAEQLREDALRCLKVLYFIEDKRAGHRRPKIRRSRDDVSRALLDYLCSDGVL